MAVEAARGAAEAAAGCSLAFDEVNLFHEKRAQLLRENERYVAAHPELAQLLHDFVQAALVVKPSDLTTFAAQHFAVYRAPAPTASGSGGAGAGAVAGASAKPAAAAAAGGKR